MPVSSEPMRLWGGYPPTWSADDSDLV